MKEQRESLKLAREQADRAALSERETLKRSYASLETQRAHQRKIESSQAQKIFEAEEILKRARHPTNEGFESIGSGST